MNDDTDYELGLTSALGDQPDELSFQAVCAFVDTPPSTAAGIDALRAAAKTLDAWPSSIRLRRCSGGNARQILDALMDSPSWSLTRAVEIECSSEGMGLEGVWEHAAWSEIRHLRLIGSVGDEIVEGISQSRAFDCLEDLSIHATRLTPAGLARLLTRQLTIRLRRLELDLVRDPATRSSVLQLFSDREFPVLEDLRVSPAPAEFLAVLHGTSLPSLKSLTCSLPQAATRTTLPLGVRSLDIFSSRFDHELLESLVVDLHSSGLQTLRLSYCHLPADTLPIIVGSGLARSLVTLDLSGNDLGSDAATALEGFDRLRRLNLSSTQLCDSGLSRLLGSRCATELEFVDLSHNKIRGAINLPNGVRNLRPRQIDISHNPLSTEGFTSLIECISMDRLESFRSHSYEMAFPPEATKVLATVLGSSACTGTFSDLSLVNWKFDEESIEAMARSGISGSLRCLELTAGGIQALWLGVLLSSGRWPRLRRLAVSEGRGKCSADFVEVISSSAVAANLWDITLWELTDDGWERLADSRALVSLVHGTFGGEPGELAAPRLPLSTFAHRLETVSIGGDLEAWASCEALRPVLRAFTKGEAVE